MSHASRCVTDLIFNIIAGKCRVAPRDYLPLDSNLTTFSQQLPVLRENHQQLQREMGVEGFKKEYVCDMGIDIDLIADYFGKKRGLQKLV